MHTLSTYQEPRSRQPGQLVHASSSSPHWHVFPSLEQVHLGRYQHKPAIHRRERERVAVELDTEPAMRRSSARETRCSPGGRGRWWGDVQETTSGRGISSNSSRAYRGSRLRSARCVRSGHRRPPSSGRRRGTWRPTPGSSSAPWRWHGCSRVRLEIFLLGQRQRTGNAARVSSPAAELWEIVAHWHGDGYGSFEKKKWRRLRAPTSSCSAGASPTARSAARTPPAPHQTALALAATEPHLRILSPSRVPLFASARRQALALETAGSWCLSWSASSRCSPRWRLCRAEKKSLFV